MIEPLRVEFDVECPREHAFSIWTEHIDRWWPRSHSVSGDPVHVTLERQVGGRLFEHTADGREIVWGAVSEWDPPERFAYQWHMRRDRGDATDVVITFVDLGGNRTRVEILHSGWERLGEEGPGWRDANRGGWDGLVPSFIRACNDNANKEQSV